MKKTVPLILLLALAAAFVPGCSSGNTRSPVTQETSVSQTVTQTAPVSETETEAQREKETFPEDENAVDLARMDGNLAYAQAVQMTQEPGGYEGKTVIVYGTYGTRPSPDGKTLFRACVVRDSTACCATGIEFELKDETPAYPEEGAYITVRGVFDSYEENGYTIPRLTEAEMIVE
ncbi:MAG: hypothetical protein K6F64_01635 [Clostridia bacterium]|nr:hypothetical protein [Clostridia bacterium]